MLTDVTPETVIAKEETFGPVVPLYRFKMDAAIMMANDTEFGLDACFYGRNIRTIWRVTEALEFGTVGINARSSQPRRWAGAGKAFGLLAISPRHMIACNHARGETR